MAILEEDGELDMARDEHEVVKVGMGIATCVKSSKKRSCRYLKLTDDQ